MWNDGENIWFWQQQGMLREDPGTLGGDRGHPQKTTHSKNGGKAQAVAIKQGSVGPKAGLVSGHRKQFPAQDALPSCFPGTAPCLLHGAHPVQGFP